MSAAPLQSITAERAAKWRQRLPRPGPQAPAHGALGTLNVIEALIKGRNIIRSDHLLSIHL